MPEPRRLYEQIAQKLSKAISSGEYAVGQRLPSERDLAQAFAVSRPTVREAIVALELDGLVEVRLGSGVYVTHREPPAGAAQYKDFGFFELLEARRSIEGESCALAAARIDEEQLAQLEGFVEEMRRANRKDDVVKSEDADRRFHEFIANCTQNSGIVAAVQMLWEARMRSPQHGSMTIKVHARGYKPSVEEHSAIVRALKRRDPDAARAAMREHLSRVMEELLEVTEIEELERARAAVAEKRRRFSSVK